MYDVLLGVTLISCVYAEMSHAQLISKFNNPHGYSLTKSKSNALRPETNSEMYFDKPDNMMRFPTPFEEVATKKLVKKRPKSTIQKIIARNRKNKKAMLNRLTTKPTVAPESEDLIEESERVDDPTTQAAIKKKVKKWNSKQKQKYQGQVQKMQVRMKNKRAKRHADRDNTLILQDFNDFEFVDRKKDYDVVRAHYKRYWK